jgi:hypothetical protein
VSGNDKRFWAVLVVREERAWCSSINLRFWAVQAERLLRLCSCHKLHEADMGLRLHLERKKEGVESRRVRLLWIVGEGRATLVA